MTQDTKDLIERLRHPGWTQAEQDGALTYLEAMQGALEHFRTTARANLQDAVNHSKRAIAAEAVNGKLWDALLWIDTFDPETIAAAEDKFGLDVARALLKEPTP